MKGRKTTNQTNESESDSFKWNYTNLYEFQSVQQNIIFFCIPSRCSSFDRFAASKNCANISLKNGLYYAPIEPLTDTASENEIKYSK